MDDSRKFTFAAIGIKPGSVITLIHGGQQVITTDDNRIEYQSKVYTLSGFCKEFMPDDRRNKANSYRGCAFFSYEGVKLEKMFKKALKTKEGNEEFAPAPLTPEAKTSEVTYPGTVPSDSIAGPPPDSRALALIQQSTFNIEKAFVPKHLSIIVLRYFGTFCFPFS